MWNLFRFFIWTTALTFFSSSVYAQLNENRAIEPGKQKLLIVLKSGSAQPKIQEKWWQICSKIGSKLLVGVGPHGYGIFSDFSCFDENKKISGTLTERRWALIVTPVENKGKKSINFTLKINRETNYEDGSSAIFGINGFAVSEVSHAVVDKIDVLLQDEDFLNLIAFSLLEQAPFSVAAPENSISYKYVKTLGTRWSLPPLSEQMTMFDVRYNASKDAWDTGRTKYLKSEPVTSRPNSGSVKLRWLHSSFSRATILPQLQAQIDAATREYSKDTPSVEEENRVSGGLFHVRYGFSLVRNTELMKKATLVGLELRSKRTANREIVAWYDLVPSVKATTVNKLGTEESSSLRWGRFALGADFHGDFRDWTKGILQRISLIPRVSFWNLDFSVNSSGVLKTFKLERDFSVGIDLGVAREIGKFEIRLLAGTEAAGYFSKISNNATEEAIGKSSQVHTVKFAGDLLAKMISFDLFAKNCYLVGKAFAQTEKITVYKTAISGEKSSAALNVTFAGLGVGLNW